MSISQEGSLPRDEHRVSRGYKEMLLQGCATSFSHVITPESLYRPKCARKHFIIWNRNALENISFLDTDGITRHH